MSFSFGAPSTAPANTSLTGGFSFGGNKPATPGFGLTATQPTTGLFGNTPATSVPAFGSTSAPAFGVTTTPAFGATTTPAFGATTTPAFGAIATPAFGAATTSSFGATATPTFGATGTPGFGATTTPSFGANISTGFGAGLGTGGLNFGTGSNTAQPTGLAFGTPATTTSTGLGGFGGFNFGNTSTTTTQGLGLGLFGTTTTTTATPFGAQLGATNVTGSQIPSTVTPSLGLGGVAPSGAGVPGAAPGGDGKDQQPKQTKLPNELSTTVESFKEFVKKQKSHSSDVMRVSIKPLYKVSRETEEILRAVLSLSGDVARSRAQSKRLRTSAANALAAAERATRDPPGSELEGPPPPSYVKELIAELEQQLIMFRRQMDVADKQMHGAPRLLTEQELTLGMRRMHESFVALAGRLQAVHAQVEAQKEQYLNLRKYILKDPTNIFESKTPNTSLDQILKEAEANRKKVKLSGVPDAGSSVLTNTRTGNIQQLAGPTPFAYLGNNFTSFSTSNTPAMNWNQPQSFGASVNRSNFRNISAPTIEPGTSSFQLQKPPKRGKQ